MEKDLQLYSSVMLGDDIVELIDYMDYSRLKR